MSFHGDSRAPAGPGLIPIEYTGTTGTGPTSGTPLVFNRGGVGDETKRGNLLALSITGRQDKLGTLEGGDWEYDRLKVGAIRGPLFWRIRDANMHWWSWIYSTSIEGGGGAGGQGRIKQGDGEFVSFGSGTFYQPTGTKGGSASKKNAGKLTTTVAFGDRTTSSGTPAPLSSRVPGPMLIVPITPAGISGAFDSVVWTPPREWPSFPLDYEGLTVGSPEQPTRPMFHPTDPRIPIINAGREPMMGAMCVDTNRFGIIDLDRTARLHSALRILKLPSNSPDNAVGIHMGYSGNADTRGGYLVDIPTAFSNSRSRRSPTSGTPQAQLSTSGMTHRQFMQAMGINLGLVQSGAISSIALKGYGFAQGLWTQMTANGLIQGGGSFRGNKPVTNFNPNFATGGFAGSSASANGGKGQGNVEGQILAMMSRNDGGPFDVGTAVDPHRLGTDDDGNFINPLHLSTDALWINRLRTREDGPMLFEETFKEGKDYDFKTRVHLAFDTATGTFRWWSTSAEDSPDNPPSSPPPPVTPPEQPPVDTPRDDPRGPTSGTPRHPRPNPEDENFFDRPGAGPGPLPATFGSTLPTVSPRPRRTKLVLQPSFDVFEPKSALATVRSRMAPALTFVAPNYSEGVRDLRYGQDELTDRDITRAYNTHPMTGRFEGFAAQSTGIGFQYTQKPNVLTRGAGRWRGGTADGGTVFLPPELDMEAAIGDQWAELIAAGGVSQACLVMGPNTSLAFGKPSLVDGCVLDGGTVLSKGVLVDGVLVSEPGNDGSQSVVAAGFFAVGNENGLRGVLMARSEANGDLVSVIGADITGFVINEPNSAVQLLGTGVYLNATAGYSLRIPDGTLPAAVEDHVVKFGSVFVGPDGDDYVTLEAGPEIQYQKDESDVDAADYDLNSELPVEMTGLVVTTSVAFSDVTTVSYSVMCSEEGGRNCDFAIQVLRDGSPYGLVKNITLNGNQQFTTGAQTVTPAPAAGVVFTVRVTATKTNPNADPWIRGSVQEAELFIRQDGAVGFSAFGASTAQELDDDVTEVLSLESPFELPQGWTLSSDELTPVFPAAATAVPLVFSAQVTTTNPSVMNDYHLDVDIEKWNGATWDVIAGASGFDNPKSATDRLSVSIPPLAVLWTPGNKYRVRINCRNTSPQTYDIDPSRTWFSVRRGRKM